jgi:hypothetical protein
MMATSTRKQEKRRKRRSRRSQVPLKNLWKMKLILLRPDSLKA